MPSPSELPHNPIPTLEAVNAAYGEVLAHNSEHTGYRPAFKIAFAGLIEGADPAAQVAEEDTVTEGDMHADLVDMFHGDTFMRLGIKLAPLGDRQVAGKTPVGSVELVPMVDNTVLYTEFLSHIQPEDVDEEGERFLSDVIANLARQSGASIRAENNEELSEQERTALAEFGEDSLRTFATIDPEYARLGLDTEGLRARLGKASPAYRQWRAGQKSGGVIPAEVAAEHKAHEADRSRLTVYRNMENRVTYWGRGLLSEYMEAERGQYLADPEEQGFGPVSWHKDGGQPHWQGAFDYLARLDIDDSTKPLADEVRHGLVMSLDAAIAETHTDVPDYIQEQRVDLENIRDALQGKEYDTERLAAYIKKR